jgi:hypothetical protein
LSKNLENEKRCCIFVKQLGNKNLIEKRKKFLKILENNLNFYIFVEYIKSPSKKGEKNKDKKSYKKFGN